MLTFNNLILYGFILRIFFVAMSGFISIKTIGFENIQFLFKYIKRSFFSIKTLFTWLIAFLSIGYFEHLVSDANGISFLSVYEKNSFLTIVTLVLLFIVIMKAILDLMNSRKEAEEAKKDLFWAKGIKKVTQSVSVGAWFSPFGILGKTAISVTSYGVNKFVDNKVKNTLSDKISQNIKGMLIIALINLTIILISVYLITGQIIFW